MRPRDHLDAAVARAACQPGGKDKIPVLKPLITLHQECPVMRGESDLGEDVERGARQQPALGGTCSTTALFLRGAEGFLELRRCAARHQSSSASSSESSTALASSCRNTWLTRYWTGLAVSDRGKTAA